MNSLLFSVWLVVDCFGLVRFVFFVKCVVIFFVAVFLGFFCPPFFFLLFMTLFDYLLPKTLKTKQ